MSANIYHHFLRQKYITVKLQSRKAILYKNRDDFAIFTVFEGKKGSLCE